MAAGGRARGCCLSLRLEVFQADRTDDLARRRSDQQQVADDIQPVRGHRSAWSKLLIAGRLGAGDAIEMGYSTRAESRGQRTERREEAPPWPESSPPPPLPVVVVTVRCPGRAAHPMPPPPSPPLP